MNPLFSAYEPTVDDVANVMSMYGADCSDAEAERLFDDYILGDESVPSAALDGGCELDGQTDAANQRIAQILFEAEELPNAVLCSRCGNVVVAGSAHLHQDKHVGECCWDERLRTTE